MDDDPQDEIQELRDFIAELESRIKHLVLVRAEADRYGWDYTDYNYDIGSIVYWDMLYQCTANRRQLMLERLNRYN